MRVSLNGLAARKEVPYPYLMIIGRITAKAQTTIPRAVRIALGLNPGDRVVYAIENGKAILTRFDDEEADGFVGNFSTFTEWADELDSVYDNL